MPADDDADDDDDEDDVSIGRLTAAEFCTVLCCRC